MAPDRPVTLLTFASAPFYRQQTSLNQSAMKMGVTRCSAWTEADLKATAFYRDFIEIFSETRGFGFWIWKPYLILQELEKLKPGEFLVYYDVGRANLPHRMSRPIGPLLAWCEQKNAGMLPGVYVPEHGPNCRWTKRECFVLMNCDQPRFWHHPQIQATYSVWQKTPESEAFVGEWLKWCITPGVVTDKQFIPRIANFPEFVDHRHDQSVLTNLVIAKGLRCYGDPSVPLPGSKDINNMVDRVMNRELSLRVRVARRTAGRYLRGGVRLVKKTLRPTFGGSLAEKDDRR